MGRILDLTFKIGLHADLPQGVLMPSLCSFSFQDYARELSTVRFRVQTMTAANFDATNTLILALQAAIIAVQAEDTLQSRRVLSEDAFVSRVPATIKAMKRENKWLLIAEDSTTHQVFKHEIPGADTDLLGSNSEYVVLTAGDGQALKTAFDACVKSPAGNASSLISMQYVGKRL